MSLYAPAVPVFGIGAVLLPETLQQRPFPEGSEFSQLVQDTYQLANDTAEAQSYLLLPSSCVTLLFLIGSSSSAVLCGPLTAARRFTLPPKSTAYCVRLRSGCGEWIIDGDVASLTDRAVPLTTYLPEASQLLGQLSCSDTFQQRNAHIFRLLDAQSARGYQSMALLRRCLSLIDQHHGQLSVSQLAEEVGCSERYLSRIFRRRVGVSTKTQCELVQLHYALHTMYSTQPKSLLHIAVACGYFDQAHMNRHYRRFLHCSASAVRSGHLSGQAPCLLTPEQEDPQ